MKTLTALCLLASATLLQAAPPAQPPPPPIPRSITLLKEFRPIGGNGNNLDNVDLNAIPGDPELHLAPLNFAPNSTNGLISGTNPRTISNVIAGGTGARGENGETTDPIASAWIYVFGQFLDHDLSLETNPVNGTPINIVIPEGDPVFTAGTNIVMTRDLRDTKTNTIINTTAGYLDLSQLYGSTQETADNLRNDDGTLASSDNGAALPVVNDTFVTGDPRVMENPELTAITTLFMREHNFWVRTLQAQHRSWTGDQLYEMARAITTAEYQNIVYQEYLPVLVGPVTGPYRGYDSSVNPQVTQEFTTAAFRSGHSQVSDTQTGIDNSGNEVFSQSLAESFFNTPEIDENNGFDPLLRGLGAENAQATDVYAVSALRNLLFAGLAGGGVDEMDLIAIDIQRQRDVGLGSLNQTRRALGLNQYNSFSQLTRDRTLAKNLEDIYGSVDQVDLFIGGLAEPHAPGALVGPTFQAIIAHQFDALRAGDRFFWMNQNFDAATKAMIARTTLADLIRRNTDTTARLQPNLFIQADLGTSPEKTHVQPPPSVDRHGRDGHSFLNDGI